MEAKVSLGGSQPNILQTTPFPLPTDVESAKRRTASATSSQWTADLFERAVANGEMLAVVATCYATQAC